jgi:hypothetical protein
MGYCKEKAYKKALENDLAHLYEMSVYQPQFAEFFSSQIAEIEKELERVS